MDGNEKYKLLGKVIKLSNEENIVLSLLQADNNKHFASAQSFMDIYSQGKKELFKIIHAKYPETKDWNLQYNSESGEVTFIIPQD